MPKDAGTESIHQRITLVAVIKVNIAAHIWNTQTISIMRNSADYSTEQSFYLTGLERAKA